MIDDGVAGSVVVNYAKTNTRAVIGLDHDAIASPAVQLTLGGGDVGIAVINFPIFTARGRADDRRDAAADAFAQRLDIDGDHHRDEKCGVEKNYPDDALGIRAFGRRPR